MDKFEMRIHVLTKILDAEPVGTFVFRVNAPSDVYEVCHKISTGEWMYLGDPTYPCSSVRLARQIIVNTNSVWSLS